MLGHLTAHGVQGLFADSFNVLEPVLVQGLFEIPQASNAKPFVQGSDGLGPGLPTLVSHRPRTLGPLRGALAIDTASQSNLPSPQTSQIPHRMNV